MPTKFTSFLVGPSTNPDESKSFIQGKLALEKEITLIISMSNYNNYFGFLVEKSELFTKIVVVEEIINDKPIQMRYFYPFGKCRFFDKLENTWFRLETINKNIMFINNVNIVNGNVYPNINWNVSSGEAHDMYCNSLYILSSTDAERDDMINGRLTMDVLGPNNGYSDKTKKWVHNCEEMKLLGIKPDTSNISQEQSFLDLLRNVLLNGEERIDRTSIGTLSIFSPPTIEFDLKKGFPLLTTKKMGFKTIFHELLWFISGSTNTKYLDDNGVKIWKDNTSREFLDSRKLTDYNVGELGPGYGFQWRHFGATYVPNKEIQEGGFDQLSDVINTIRNDPFSRRIFMSAWNPSDLSKVALPPCHISVQFYVSKVVNKKNTLSAKVYIRSNDLFLGAPFNIVSYALLLHMIANITDMNVGTLFYTLGDAHIYKNSIDQVKELLSRKPLRFPTLKIAEGIKEIDDYTIDSISVVGYNSHPAIKCKMAI